MSANRDFVNALKRYYTWYTAGFVTFIVLLSVLEQMGLSRRWIGYIFLMSTVALYAGIGIMSRTVDVAEYYVAGRRVPAVFNGMATGADWMSAASFIGMAGALMLQGYSGLAYIMGWTGGYCLVALLLAPYLRKFGQFTIPDFLGARYGGHFARLVGVFCAIMCSFVYVVAQIYGVGLITTRLTGVSFQVGVFLGLGGILVCSFLGGMKAVTWTQVAQFIILVIAYLVPVVWLSVKHTSNPVPQLIYGGVLAKVTEREKQLINDPKEIQVREIFRQRAQEAQLKLNGLPQSFATERERAQQALASLRADTSDMVAVQRAERALIEFPRDVAAARALWTKQAAIGARAEPPVAHGEPFPGKDETERSASRKNFLALIFCLMVGTAALPHILMRFYTTPNVREARQSVFWSLICIFILYVTAPALAVLVKYEIYNFVVGAEITKLPAWVASWSKVDPLLLSISDINKDGILQLAEMVIGPDIVVLATPEIAGLPYVVSGMVAAGGLAAALSTADGLLLTIANALSHDIYYKIIDPGATAVRRVMISKVLLLMVALVAAYVASRKVADIMDLVAVAFSLAGASFFPALVLGIFWKRANKWGAVCGMLAGFSVTFYYMVLTQPWLRELFGVVAPIKELMWWDIQPVSAAVFGVPLGFAVIAIVSWLTPPPDRLTQQLVEFVRYPRLASEDATVRS